MDSNGLVGTVLFAQGLTLVVLDGLEHTFGILTLTVLGPILLLLLLVLLLLLILLLLLLVLLVLLILLILLILLLLLLLLLVLILLLLVLLLLLLLQQAEGVGEVVAGVIVLRVKLEGFLIAFDGLLQALPLLGLLGRLEVAIPLIVECLGSLFLAEVLTCKRLGIVTGGFVIFFLPIKGIGEIVLSAEVGGVAFQSTAVCHFRVVVALLVVGTVALTQLVARSLR